MAQRTCSLNGCERGGKIVRGLCRVHYERWRVYGRISYQRMPPMMNDADFAEWFWSQVVPNGDCLEWQRGVNRHGYGRVTWRGKRELAHRVAFLLRAPIPDDTPCVIHKCDNPPCVNLDHLRLGTKADNTADMTAKGRARGRFQPGHKMPWRH